MQERRTSKNSSRQLRHNPLGGSEQKSSVRNNLKQTQDEEMLSNSLSQSIIKQAKEQRDELAEDDNDNEDADLGAEDDEDALQVGKHDDLFYDLFLFAHIYVDRR